MSNYDTDFLQGVAQHLAAQDLGVWNPAGAYTDAETGIVLDKMPQSPANVIVLGTYGVSDSPSEASSVLGLQIRTRAAGEDPRACRSLGASINLDLHGRTQFTLPTGLHIVQVLRQSWTSGGQDANGRWSLIQNLYAWLYVPALNVHPIEEVAP